MMDKSNMGPATITSREVALSIIPHITGGLSVLGSSVIAGRVLCNQRRRQKTYHRLLCALSIFDFISSFSYAMSTWPIPRDSGPNDEWNSPFHYGAIGNDATCIAQGFGIQIGITAAFYNVMLSIHYILTIKYNIPEHILKQKVEPYMLAIPIVLGLALSIPPLVLNLYNNSKLWCWIGPNFDQCEIDGLTPEQCSQQTYVYRWIFYYGPCWLGLFIITCLQIWLVITVYQTEQRTKKYTNPKFSNTTAAKSLIKQPQTSSTTNSSSSSNNIKNNSADNPLPTGATTSTEENSSKHRQQPTPTLTVSNQGRTKREKRSTKIKNASGLFDSLRRSALRRTKSGGGVTTTTTTAKRNTSEPKQKQQRSLTKEVAIQASLYVGIFYITWIPKTLTSITTGMKAWVLPNNNGFYLLLVIVIVTPIQGFMNLFVHIRKTTLKFIKTKLWTTCTKWCRNENGEWNCCSCFKKSKKDSDGIDVDETHRIPHFTDVEEQEQQLRQQQVAITDNNACMEDPIKATDGIIDTVVLPQNSPYENEPNPVTTGLGDAPIVNGEEENLLAIYELDD